MIGGVMLQFDFFAWLAGIPDWILGVLKWIYGIFSYVFHWIFNVFTWIWTTIFIPKNFMFLFRAVIFPGLIFVVMALIWAVWFTRKLWGRIQDRRGPLHMGKYGGLQLFADAIKLIGKETIIPDKAKRWMFRFLPGLLLVIVLLPFAFIPWDTVSAVDGGWAISDLNVSLVLAFAFLTAVPVIALLAGWVSGSKYTLIGGFRAANNQFAAEIPMIISTIGCAFLARSLSIFDISMAQSSLWFAILLPINLATFLVAAIASVGVFPFDAPVADSEIIFGWRTEYTGIYFTLTYFAEFAEQMLYSALIVALFLGGPNGLPFLPGPVNFIIKFLITFFFFVLVSSSFQRLRQDQIVYFCWKYLLPLAVLNVIVIMFAVVYLPGLMLPLLGVG
ncbi:MAG: NADH-quinone oxidoreductase subunit H [Candidatus Thorarchaeota archaeon]|nr:NADH-quinone oxidoreductase subunit H [Candidatus Thorarchaeota archaeon]